ncbi:MAG: hypothetical protein KAR06_08685 [Deltaproteobacteria bacterium]|nr:hypothetical protein [Deltaproteobacteria bacterium]
MAYDPSLAAYYEGWTRLELIQRVLRGLSQPVTTPGTDTDADYTRYPKQDIINELITAEVRFAQATNILMTFAIVEAVADRSTYRLPSNHLKTLAAKYYRSSTDYDELQILTNRNELKRRSRSFATDSSSNSLRYYAPSYHHGNIRSYTCYPATSTAGTTYSGDSMGIVTSATNFTFSGSLTGTHKTGYANSAFYVDADGRDLASLGVVVGMMIFNVTDGSSGQITAVGNQDATNDKISVTLSGGTDDDFDVADSVDIRVGEYGVVIRANTTEEWAFTSEYGALQDINPLAGNFLLDYARMPIRLNLDTQYPETPKEWQFMLVEYAIWKLGGTEYDGATQNERAGQAKGEWENGLVLAGQAFNEEAEVSTQVEDREANFFGEEGGYLSD